MKFSHMTYGAACSTLLFAVASMGPAHAGTSSGSTEPTPHACLAKPPLADQPWELDYSFGGGLPMPGQGWVHLKLHSDGTALVTTSVDQKPTQTRTVNIPTAAMAKVRAVLHRSPPTCMHTARREGYIVYDIGAYTPKFSQAGTTVDAYVDGCHYVDRGADAFGAIIDSIQGLKPYLGEEITWSTTAMTSAKSDACAQSYGK